MFVELMGAAYRFDPQRTSPEGWASYAWMTIEHARWRGVDDAGVVRKRTTGPRPTTVALDGRDPASQAPDPGEVVEDLGYSESTARRRIKEAREHIMDALVSNVDDRLWTPFDKGTDPVLERAQRQFEQAFPPPASPETSRGLQRWANHILGGCGSPTRYLDGQVGRRADGRHRQADRERHPETSRADGAVGLGGERRRGPESAR